MAQQSGSLKQKHWHSSSVTCMVHSAPSACSSGRTSNDEKHSSSTNKQGQGYTVTRSGSYQGLQGLQENTVKQTGNAPDGHRTSPKLQLFIFFKFLDFWEFQGKVSRIFMVIKCHDYMIKMQFKVTITSLKLLEVNTLKHMIHNGLTKSASSLRVKSCPWM